jgi:hypothetical protein
LAGERRDERETNKIVLMNANPFRRNLELVKPALRGFQIQMIFDVVKGKFFSLFLPGRFA